MENHRKPSSKDRNDTLIQNWFDTIPQINKEYLKIQIYEIFKKTETFPGIVSIYTFIRSFKRFSNFLILNSLFSSVRGLKCCSACWATERRHSWLEDRKVLHSVIISCTKCNLPRHSNALLKSWGLSWDLHLSWKINAY